MLRRFCFNLKGFVFQGSSGRVTGSVAYVRRSKPCIRRAPDPQGNMSKSKNLLHRLHAFCDVPTSERIVPTLCTLRRSSPLPTAHEQQYYVHLWNKHTQGTFDDRTCESAGHRKGHRHLALWAQVSMPSGAWSHSR